MASLNLRFRKSIVLIPGILKFTLSKKGYSLNLNLGFFSKTWGSMRNTTTIDAPGHLGLSWRKEERRKKAAPGEPSDGFAHAFQVFLMFGGALVGLARLHAATLGKTCAFTGHPHFLLAAMLGAQLGLFWFLWNSWRPFRGILGVVLSLGACYLQWRLYGALVAPSVDCSL